MLELSRVYIVASVAESVLPIFEPDPSDRTNTIETGHREVVTLAPLLSEKRSLYGADYHRTLQLELMKGSETGQLKPGQYVKLAVLTEGLQ